MTRDTTAKAEPGQVVYPCCHCCGTNDPDYGVGAYWVATCPRMDKHPDPCLMCGQRSKAR